MTDIAVIVASAIGGLTTIVCSSLWFADRTLKRQLMDDPVERKRKHLIEARTTWSKIVEDTHDATVRANAVNNLREVDRELTALP